MIISILLSCNVLATDIAPEIDETVLLQASQEIIDAQVKYYDIENVAVLNPTYVSKKDGGYYVEYILELTMKLKYDNATELPQIRGLAGAFNIDSTVLTTQEFSQKMQSSEVLENTALATSAEASKLAYSLNDNEITILASTFSDSVTIVAQSECTSARERTVIADNISSLGVATMQPTDKELIVAAAIADLATTDVVNFVQEVEIDNIGISHTFNYYLKAEFDNKNTFLGIEYGIADGFTDDISCIIPRPENEMILLGEQ